MEQLKVSLEVLVKGIVDLNPKCSAADSYLYLQLNFN